MENKSLPQKVEDDTGNTLEDLGVEPELVRAVSIALRKSFSGPLPPSEDFAAYDATSPGTAERIVVFMEKEQAHRHGVEERSLKLKEQETLRGQIMAYSIAVLLVGGAIYASFLGQTVIAGLFLGGAALGAVKHLIDGRKE